MGLLALVLSLSSGCKKKERKPGPVRQAQSQPVAVPKLVLAYGGVKNPQRTIDDALAVGQKLGPIPMTRDALLDLFAQKAKIPRDLMAAVDITGTFWMVLLDEKKLGESDASVLLFPLKSKKEFEAALGKRMKKGGSEGKLTVYKPKPGEVGLQETRLLISDKGVIAPTSQKALQACETFIERNLIGQTPAHDATLHILLEHIFKSQGTDLDKEVDQVMSKMAKQMAEKPETSPIDQSTVVGATEKTIRHYTEMIKSTREVILGADVDQKRLLLTLQGVAAPGGKLHKVIRRQRPGAPLGIGALPASSWLLLADHGNPEALAEDQKTYKPLMQEFFKGMKMDPAQIEELSKLTETLGEAWTGDYAFAIHRGPSGKGLTLSALGGISDAEKTRTGVDRAMAIVGDWIKEKMKSKGEKLPEGMELKQRPFAYKEAKGTLMELSVSLPEEKTAAKKEQMEKILAAVGLPVTFGWAFTDRQMLVAMGKDVEQQLKLLAEGKTASGERCLKDKENFASALKAGANRVGIAYLDLVELLHWLEGLQIPEIQPVVQAVAGKEARTALSLDWGISDDRSAIDFTLRLPVEHFMTLKPALEQVGQMIKGEGSGSGAGGARWRDL